MLANICHRRTINVGEGRLGHAVAYRPIAAYIVGWVNWQGWELAKAKTISISILSMGETTEHIASVLKPYTLVIYKHQQVIVHDVPVSFSAIRFSEITLVCANVWSYPMNLYICTNKMLTDPYIIYYFKDENISSILVLVNTEWEENHVAGRCTKKWQHWQPALSFLR